MHARFGLILLSFGFLPNIHAGDDTSYTLVVTREFNNFVGRAVDQRIFINDKLIGTVANGDTVRFSVPINATGKYEARVTQWGNFFDGAKQSFTAKAGEEIQLTTAIDVAVTDGHRIRSIFVHTLDPLKFKVPNGSGTLSIDGNSYSVTTDTVVELPQKAPSNRAVRKEVTFSNGFTTSSFVVFLRPGRMNQLPLGTSQDPDVELLNSVTFLQQLRNSVIYHLGKDFNDLETTLGKLEEDLGKIRTEGVPANVVKLREEYIQFFREIRKAQDETSSATIAKNVIGNALQCGIEALITRQKPSRLDLLGTAVATMFSTMFSKFEANERVQEATRIFKTAEEAILSDFSSKLEARPALLKHEALQEMQIARLILGDWAFTSKDPATMRGQVYRFGEDSKLIQLDPTQDKEQRKSEATYEVRDNLITVRWTDGAIETAKPDFLADGRVIYPIINHTSDATQIGWNVSMYKLKPTECSGVFTMKNDTDGPVTVYVRYSLRDGTKTDWLSFDVKSKDSVVQYYNGAYHAEIDYDANYAEGYQSMKYYWPLNIHYGATAPTLQNGREFILVKQETGNIGVIYGRP